MSENPTGATIADFQEARDAKVKQNLDVHGRVKPKARGWIHAFALPLAIAGSIVLIVLANGTLQTLACSIYLVTSILLFGVSATYHIGNWSDKITQMFRRFDHTNIFLIIAGTNTPIAVACLQPDERNLILSVVWGAAILAIILHMIWLNAPRVLYVAVYIIIGLSPVFLAQSIIQSGKYGLVTAIMIAAGGIAYITGAIFYAVKKPNISQKWFGFHELFHTFTVIGYACHMIAIFFAILGTY